MEVVTAKFPKRLQRIIDQKHKQHLPRPSKLVPPIPVEASESSDSESEERDGLGWKPVGRSHLKTGFDDAAVLAFEELDGVDVVYEEQVGRGKVAKLTPKRQLGIDGDSKATGARPAKRRKTMPDSVTDDFDSDANLSKWSAIPLLPALKRQIHASGFTTPTEIQGQALPFALAGRDVIGVAETGSGKTLAYGLPILQHILASLASTPSSSSPRRIKALVLAPTRELALQVSEHLSALSPVPSIDSEGVKSPPLVSTAAIVGGMSAQKQRRVLERGIDILIATPGRLWDLIQEDDSIAQQIRDISFLVLDEADRMIETGHFLELENIVKLTLRHGAKDEGPAQETDQEFLELEKKAGLASDVDQNQNERMQTFVYSATLSKDLQQNLKRKNGAFHRAGGKKGKKHTPSSTLDDLLYRLDFRDPEPEVIDLSPEGGIVDTLQEAKIECVKNDKDLYLYYFLLRYPGRSLVFVTSIDSIRRIMPLLEILQVPAWPLHSQLQQKQRLKNLDRFKSHPTGVLIATDVAARGLDIPLVTHVVHYQLPRSADVYVHRNGRTARAGNEGFSLCLVGSEEGGIEKGLMRSLEREHDLPTLVPSYAMLAKLKDRLLLARQIDNAQHNVKKDNHEKKWLKETADALDIELGSEFEMSDGEEVGGGGGKKKGKKNKNVNDEDTPFTRKQRSSAKVLSLRAQMKSLLAQPLVAQGISMKYITSGSMRVVDDLVGGSNHQAMLGLSTAGAQADIVKSKRTKTIGAGRAPRPNGKSPK